MHTATSPYDQRRSYRRCRLSFARGLTLCVAVAGAKAIAAEPNAHATKIPPRAIFQRSISDVSGDIFLLTEPFNYLLDDAEFEVKEKHSSHISTHQDGKVDVILPPHAISMHGYAWDYDLRIPLAFYDPSGKWFKPGNYEAVAVQQDIAPTLANVLGIAAPDRAEGRILTEARITAKPPAAAPRIVAVIVQDQMGLQYFAAHPGQAKFIRGLMQKSASFLNAQVAHVDVETSVGHAAIGSGAYARGHHISANTAWHPGLWSAAPVYAAALTETLSSEMYPLTYDAATLADVWLKANDNKPQVLSMVSAARASVSLGGHGSMFNGSKKTAVMYLEEHGEQAGSYTTNSSFYTLPAAAKDLQLQTYAEAFLKEKGGKWYDHPMYKANGKLDLGAARASPALVRMERDLLLGSLEEMHFGKSGVTDLLFLNFKTSDYCGHYYGFESQECGEVLEEVDRAVQDVVTKIEALSAGSFVVAYTADHGAAPIPELSGGVRYSRDKIRAALNQRFSAAGSRVEAVPFMSSSQIWLNRPELKKNGHTVAEVVTFLKDLEVPMASPWNELATEWLAKGKPKQAKLFHDVVSREELEGKTEGKTR